MSGARLFPILVLAFASGILCGSLLCLQLLWVISFFLFLGGWILLGTKDKLVVAQRIMAFFVFLTLGAWHGQRGTANNLPWEHGLPQSETEPCDLEGVLIRPPELRPDGVRLLVELGALFEGLEAKKINVRMLLTVAKGGERFRYGDRLRFKTKLRLPERRLNPGAPDRARSLALRGVAFLGFLPDAEHALLMERGRGLWVRQQVEDLRWELTRLISMELPSPAKEVLLALIVGQAKALPPKHREAFATLGLSHILAVSGLHFGLVALGVYWVSMKLLSLWPGLVLRFPIQKLAWIMTIPTLLAYGILAGMTPSVQRSLIMVLALAGALIMDRVRRLYHALALAALIILVLNPSSLFELSFQLSFLAVMGIIYCVPKLMALLPPKDQSPSPSNKKWNWIPWEKTLLAALTTLVASFVTLPLVVMHFHLVPVYSIPANLLGLPVLGWLILPMALLGGFLSLVWEAAGLALLWVACWMTDWVMRIIFWAASWGGVFYLPTPRFWEIVIFYLICLGVCSIRQVPWAGRATLGLVLVLIFLWTGQWVAKLRDQNLRLHFIAVGNGTSVLMEAPGGKSLLLDGGGNLEGRPDVGAMCVAPVLWDRRIMSLSRIILSHPHPDHLGGLFFILRAFKVKDGIWDNGHRPRDESYLEFVKAVQNLGWTPRALCSKETWYMGQARLEVLHPPCQGLPLRSKSRASETNNRSLVLRVNMGEVSVLLPGDVEAEAERLLLDREDLACTVLLAPHHGSRSSSTEDFVKRVMPRIVIFSSKAGQGGLVHPQVLQRYRELGAEIFHTGEDGMVSLETDGKALELKTFLTRRNHKILLSKDPGGAFLPDAGPNRYD